MHVILHRGVSLVVTLVVALVTHGYLHLPYFYRTHQNGQGWVVHGKPRTPNPPLFPLETRLCDV